MNNTITAQELKTKGAQLLQKRTKTIPELFITVRGATRFVVLTTEEYDRLKECELDQAVREVQADVDAGRVHTTSLDEHLEDLRHV